MARDRTYELTLDLCDINHLFVEPGITRLFIFVCVLRR